MANFSFKITGLPEPVDGVVEGHNFTQGAPHTKIYEGYTGLTFRNCNLHNCDVPSDSKTESCNTGQTSFCSHNNPKWLANGFISECVTECIHMIVKDTVTVDGVIVDTNYSYSDKVA